EAAIQAYRGTGSGLGAYLDLAEREGADIVLPIAASAPPSRPVEDAAYEHIADIICDAVAKGGYDGMFLDLHGAMVTESFEDGEGELLRRIRERSGFGCEPLHRVSACRHHKCRPLSARRHRRRPRARRTAARRASRSGLEGSRGFRVPHRAAPTIAGPRQGDRAVKAGRG